MFEIGYKYGNWEVLSDKKAINKKNMYQCRCSCGELHLVREEVLKKAESKFCRSCMYQTEKINPGDVFGDWKIIEEIKTEEKRKIYIVQCKCGTIKTQKAIRLRFGDSICCRKCGSTRHNMSRSKTYSTWESMIQRCTNSKNINYKHYGERGIMIFEEWLIFENFLRDMGERPENKELDRTNNNGNYEKMNCRWVTHQENLNNRNNTKK